MIKKSLIIYLIFLIEHLKDCIFVGVDLYGGDIKCATANTYDECKEICVNDPECRQWTFKSPRTHACFLKGEETKSKDDPIRSGCLSIMGFKSSEPKFCSANGERTDQFVYVMDDTVVILPRYPSFTGSLEQDTALLRMMTFNRTDYLTSFEQRFAKDQPNNEILHNDQYWTKSIPHERSGPCETYNPPLPSDPGYESSMFFTLKAWDKLEIFVHERNKFFYSDNLISSSSTKRLDLSEVMKKEKNNIRILGIHFITYTGRCYN